MRLLYTSHSFKNLLNYLGMKNFTSMKWNNKPPGLPNIYPMATLGSDQFKTILQ
jgi:hypothetical protein